MYYCRAVLFFWFNFAMGLCEADTITEGVKAAMYSNFDEARLQTRNFVETVQGAANCAYPDF